MFSKIIKNGTVVDGTGKKSFRADIAIEKDKIVQVGNLKGAKAADVIDAQGKFVTPGFVDIQNHSDVYWCLFDNPNLDALISQGITTALVGNCGASLAPLLSRDALLSIRKWHSIEAINFNWISFAEYLDELSKKNYGLNIASLVGYSTLRRGLIGDEFRKLKEPELKILLGHLQQSIDAGAYGVSTGLSYAHESVIPEDELLQIARLIKNNDALFSVHLRSEGAEITEALSEVLYLVQKFNVNLKISHLKIRNKNNWHLLPHILNQLEETYQKYGNVHFDLHPYDFTWQVLYTYLPSWSYQGGRDALMHHLKDPIQRKKIADYLSAKEINYSEIYIASTAVNLNVAGKNIGEIAKRHGSTSEEVMLSIIENGGSNILVFEKNLSAQGVKELLKHSLSIVASDGAGFSFEHSDKLVHPRCFGTMPAFLNMVIEQNLLPLEQAIQKITSTPANKIGLKDRGTIEPEKFADLVIFDESINSKANQVNPYQHPIGIEYVLVNGDIAIGLGKKANKNYGIILRKKK